MSPWGRAVCVCVYLCSCIPRLSHAQTTGTHQSQLRAAAAATPTHTSSPMPTQATPHRAGEALSRPGKVNASHPSSARLWLCHMPSLSLSLPAWKAGGRYLGQEIFKSAHTHTHVTQRAWPTASLKKRWPSSPSLLLASIKPGYQCPMTSVISCSIIQMRKVRPGEGK